MSICRAAFWRSVRAADMLAPIPKLDHSEDMPDMTLLTLETDRIEATSEPRRFSVCELPMKET